MEKENKKLEYKENITTTYLKTVSAFSNYNDGEIVFGITNDLKIIGVENPEEMCLSIENQINDSIKPQPNYSLKINENKTITLFVKHGKFTPYRYKGKAYKRNDSSTVEVDEVEGKRLILEGSNISFEELSVDDSLSFEYLGHKIKDKLELSEFNVDILKSLNLYNLEKKYNNAAKLLADSNDFPGLEIVVFGSSINMIRRRISLSNISILKQYYEALEIFNEEYVLEKIEDGFRKKIELIPLTAYREVIANALVHRTWDINANTKIEMHPDKIIISSPGSLPVNMTIEDYIMGNYSYLRNPIIANVFRRLGIIEAFATGIKRINETYKDTIAKPIYNVTASAVSVTLPITDKINLSENEKKVLLSMKHVHSYNRQEIEHLSGLAKDTLIRTLNSLIEKGLVTKSGKAKNTYYMKK